MFQFFFLLVVFHSGSVEPHVDRRAAFTTYQECVNAIPEALMEVRKLMPDTEKHGQLVTVGCAKTGEVAGQGQT